MIKEIEERRKIREEIKKKKHEEAMKYLGKFFPSEIEGIILKLGATDFGVVNGGDDYEEKTGVYFFDEETLILGDDDNNSYLVFEKEEGEIVTKHITENIHVMDKYDYDSESFIRKRHEPTRIPNYLRPLIFIENKINIINNVTNNSNVNTNIKNVIANKFSTLKVLESSEVENFLERNYKRGGMCSLKDMKSHPEWMDEYKDRVQVKRVNICKSCRCKARKGCCKYYSAGNRVMLMMVIGWHK